MATSGKLLHHFKWFLFSTCSCQSSQFCSTISLFQAVADPDSSFSNDSAILPPTYTTWLSTPSLPVSPTSTLSSQNLHSYNISFLHKLSSYGLPIWPPRACARLAIATSFYIRSPRFASNSPVSQVAWFWEWFIILIEQNVQAVYRELAAQLSTLRDNAITSNAIHLLSAPPQLGNCVLHVFSMKSAWLSGLFGAAFVCFVTLVT